MFEPDCVFCDIAQSPDSHELVYEDDDVIAFFPLEPAIVGHTLVVPRQHVTDYLAASDAIQATVSAATRKVAHAVMQVIMPQGMNVITSIGKAASQTVFHWHVHVLPRWRADRVGDIWPAPTTWDDGELDGARVAIRRAVESD